MRHTLPSGIAHAAHLPIRRPSRSSTIRLTAGPPQTTIDSMLPIRQDTVMSATAVHIAVFDTLADWEIGYATAHIRRDSWQREPGRYSIVTIGPSREPVTTMGGLRVTPEIALAELRPEDSAMLILAGGDRWDQDSMAG